MYAKLVHPLAGFPRARVVTKMPEIPPKIVGDGPVQGTVMVDNGTGELLMVPVETAKNLGISMPGQPQPPTTPPSAVNQPLDFSDILSQGVPEQAQPDTLIAQGGVGSTAEALFGPGSPSPAVQSSPMQMLTPEGVASAGNSPSDIVHTDSNVAPPGVLGRDTRRAEAPLSEPQVVGSMSQPGGQSMSIQLPEGIVNLTPEQMSQVESRAEGEGRTIADVAQEAVASGTLRVLQGRGSANALRGPGREQAILDLQNANAQAQAALEKLEILRAEGMHITREGGDIQEKAAVNTAQEIEGLTADLNRAEAQRLHDRDIQEKEVAAEVAHLSSMMENLSTQRVDPNRLFAGTPARLSAAIGAGVGAALSAAERMTFGTDGGNVALGIINEAIERDIQAQVVNYNRAAGEVAQQNSLIGLLRQRTGDIDAAANLARSVQTDIAVKELMAMRARTRGETQRNAIDLLINDMRARAEAQKLEGLNASMVAIDERLNQRVSTGPGLRTLERAGKIVERSAGQLAGVGADGIADPSALIGGMFRFAPGSTPQDLDPVSARGAIAIGAAADNLGNLHSVMGRGMPVTPSEITRVKAALALALQTVVEANAGTQTEGDIGRALDQLGGIGSSGPNGIRVRWNDIPWTAITWEASRDAVESARRNAISVGEAMATRGGAAHARFIPRGQRRSGQLGIEDR